MKSKQLDVSRKQPAKVAVKSGSTVRNLVQPKTMPNITNNSLQSFRIDMSKVVLQIEGFPTTHVKPGRKPGNGNGSIRIIMDVPMIAVQPGSGIPVFPLPPPPPPGQKIPKG